MHSRLLARFAAVSLTSALALAVLPGVAHAAGSDPVDTRPAAEGSSPAAPSDAPEVDFAQRSVPVEGRTASLGRTDVDPFRMIGVTWAPGHGASGVVADIRVRVGGEWETLDPVEESDDTEGRPGTDAVWLEEPADAITVEVKAAAGTLKDVKVSTIEPGDDSEPTTITNAAYRAASTLGIVPAESGSPKTIPRPRFVSRAGWGANAKQTCVGKGNPVVAKSKGFTLHHTAGSNSASKSSSESIIRGYQTYHVKSRGWCDIGYNFLVDSWGQVFEGRDGGVEKQIYGAHSGVTAVNTHSASVAMMGTFESVEPSAAMKTGVVELMAWRFAHHGVDPRGKMTVGGKTYNTIHGHRDAKSTACPGKRGYAWISAKGGLRDRVADYMKNATGADTDAPPTSFDIPGNLVGTGTGPDTLEFTWDAVDGAPGYRIQLSTSPTMAGATYHRFTTNAATINGLEESTQYWFRVRVIDPDSGENLGEYTQEPYSTASTTGPVYEGGFFNPVPGNLRSTAQTTTTLDLDWDDVAGAKSYRVQYSTDATMKSAKYATFAQSRGTLADLTPGTTYFVRVAMVDPVSGAKLSDYTQTPYPTVQTKPVYEGGYTYPIPRSLVATASTSSSLSLDWADVAGAPEYRVQYSTSSTMKSAKYASFTTSAGTLTGLSAGTKYFVRVAVVEKGNGGKLSDYTPTPYPSASTAAKASYPGGYSYPVPSALKSTRQTSSSLTLDWADVAGAPEYRVQYSTSSTMKSAKYASFTKSEGTLTGLSKGTSYYVRVAVVEKGNGGKLSDYTQTPYPSAVTAAAAYPGGYDHPVPESLRSMGETTTSVALDWADVAGAPEYRVQYSTNSTMKSAKYASFTSSQGTISGLAKGTKYWFRVAVVEKGNGAKLSDYTQTPYLTASTLASYTGGYGYPVPSALSATSATPSSLVLDWADVTGAPEYRVQYSTDATMKGAKYASFAKSAGTLTGLSKGTTYFFRVAVVEAGNGGKLSDYTQTPYPSAATTASYEGGYGFPIPASLKSTSATPTSLSLDWADVAGAPEYRVQYSTDATMKGAKYASFTSSQGTLSDLAPGTTYFFRVAVVEKGNGGKLSDYTQTPYPSAATDVPAAGSWPIPTGLKSTGATTSSLSFAWDAVAGAPGYRIQLSTSSSMSGATYHRFTTNSGTITGLKAGTTYWFRVRVIDPVSGENLGDYTQTPYPSVKTSGGAASTASDKVTVSGSTVTFKGHGYGHGIGMSQHGAQGAAKQGVKYDAILAHYYSGTTLGTKTGDIRVLLSGDTSANVLVAPASGLKLRTLHDDKVVTLPTSHSGRKPDRWSIEPDGGDKKKTVVKYRTGSSWYTYTSAFSGDAQFEGTTMTLIYPSGSTTKYRGALRSAKPSANSTDRNTVNVLSLEDYVRGVVAKEMPSSWAAEALKAQSVAARTYGAQAMRTTSYYDICDTTSCQVYGGQSAETANTDAAIKATAGRILTYGGKPALAQFSSSSGGWSAPGSQPYLKAVRDDWDDFSGNSVHNWSINVKTSTIQSKYSSIGTLKSISITKRNGFGDMGGRVESMTLYGSKGNKTITGTDARWAFGLRSHWFGF